MGITGRGAYKNLVRAQLMERHERGLPVSVFTPSLTAGTRLFIHSTHLGLTKECLCVFPAQESSIGSDDR